MTDKPYDLVVLQFSSNMKESEDRFVRTLGAEKIAWIANKHGYNSICIGRLGCLTKKEMIDVIRPYLSKKTIIGISTSLMLEPGHYQSALNPKVPEELQNFIDAVTEVRSEYQNDTILGGPAATGFNKYFPFAIVLEGDDGEIDIIDFLNKKLNYGISKTKLELWNIHNDDFRFLENSYVHKNEMLPIELNRGCIFSCKFCSFSRIGKKKGTYEKSMDKIKDYLVHNYENYGTQYYFLTADTVNDSDATMNSWCDMIESLPFNMYYTGFFRLDLLYKYQSTTKRLFETGLRGLNLGVETFHEKAARNIEKPFSGRRAKDFLLRLYYDIFEEQAVINTGIIIGLPPEPMESVWETVEWFKGEGKCIIPNWNSLSLPCPVRGPKGSHFESKFARNADKFGFRWPKEDNPLYWEHDTMNKFQAVKAYLRIIEEFKHTKRIGNWNHVQRLACNNDFSYIDEYFKKVKENAPNKT